VELVLVRHAMPAYDESVSPRLWPLAPDGVAAARGLVLPPGAYLVSSDEVKAWQTLAYASRAKVGDPAALDRGPITVDTRFGEVLREGEPWDGPFRELRRSYVDGAEHVGWEPRSAVAARFDEAVTDHLARADGRALVVATHGMAMTIWLAARVDLTDPGAFWAALRFPDVVRIAGSDGRWEFSAR
jgi:2,3-bisphosphoglycerate-dependent phosphoglycerate mutase